MATLARRDPSMKKKEKKNRSIIFQFAVSGQTLHPRSRRFHAGKPFRFRSGNDYDPGIKRTTVENRRVEGSASLEAGIEESEQERERERERGDRVRRGTTITITPGHARSSLSRIGWGPPSRFTEASIDGRVCVRVYARAIQKPRRRRAGIY